jgi:glycosyltransferase involved in cell wall biosynthesis
VREPSIESVNMPNIDLTVPLFSVRHHKIGGTESAIYNLVHGLAKTDAGLTLAYADTARFSPEFQQWMSAANHVKQVQMPPLPGPKNSRFVEETLFEWKRSNDSWAVYPNYFLPPRLRKRPSAVLLHDIQYKVLPHFHTSKRKAWLDFYLPRMFAGADVVFLISESEKNYVAQYFGSKAADKCKVIYNAIEWDRFDGEDISENVKQLTSVPYVLTVSHPFPQKNLSTLIKAFDKVAAAVPDVKLYLAGKESDEKRQMIAENASEQSRSRILLTGIVSDAELGELYRKSQLFVLPSIYEGFGMPAAEAMGLGIPTLVSNVASLPEVTLGKANYISDPLNADLWSDEIISMLRSGARPAEEVATAVRSAFEPKRVAETLLASLN